MCICPVSNRLYGPVCPTDSVVIAQRLHHPVCVTNPARSLPGVGDGVGGAETPLLLEFWLSLLDVETAEAVPPLSSYFKPVLGRSLYFGWVHACPNTEGCLRTSESCAPGACPRLPVPVF